MKKIIREYFIFYKQERNGIFVLLSIIIALLIYLNVSDRLNREKKIDFSKFEKEITAWNGVQTEGKKIIYRTHTESFPVQPLKHAVERFAFNPNGLSECDWKRLGLSDKQIRSIKNYESKGGKFRRKEDVKRMYVISSECYAALEPFITIPSETKSVSLRASDDKSTNVLLELNSVDSAQLLAIKGIGPFFAKNIIKYRNRLGGYHSKKQLMEVWKFDEEKYEEVEKHLTVDTSNIKKININTCTAVELKHPYIQQKTANGIVNYRLKHGNFTTVEEVKKTGLIADTTFLKMAPYLKVEN